MSKTRKPKVPKRRNPIAKEVSKMRTKVKPNKKKNSPPPKDQPSTGNYNYNSSSIFGGGDTY